jgi:hypothetical protein
VVSQSDEEPTVVQLVIATREPVANVTLFPLKQELDVSAVQSKIPSSIMIDSTNEELSKENPEPTPEYEVQRVNEPLWIISDETFDCPDPAPIPAPFDPLALIIPFAILIEETVELPPEMP